MEKLKKFLKMKYETFMIRRFDRILRTYHKNPNLSWYPAYRLGVDKLENKIDEIEMKVSYFMDKES